MADTKTTKMNLGSVLANGAVGALSQAGGSIVSAGLGALLSAFPGHTILGSLGRSMTGSGLTGAQIEANQFSHNEAELAFQRELQADSTKFQRSVADMKAAGLNPVLAAGQGAGSVHSSPAASVSPSAPNLSALMDMALRERELNIQEKLANAEIRNKDADTDNKDADTAGKRIKNDIAEATRDAQVEAASLENALKAVNIELLSDKRKEVAQNISKMAAETNSEEAKKAYFDAAAAVQRASSREISEMLAYKKLLADAQTRAAHSSANESDFAAALSAARTAYQNKLLDDGYVDAFIDNMKSEARKAGYDADSAEAKAKLDKIRAAIRTGDYEGLTFSPLGKLDAAFLSGIANFLDNFNPLAGMLR